MKYTCHLCYDALRMKCGVFSPSLTQFNDSNMFMGTHIHTRVCLCVCVWVCLTAVSSLAQTLFNSALQNHTSLQINPALTAIRGSACTGELLHDARAHFACLTFTVYSCIQFLCKVLWDSLLEISTFTTKLKTFFGSKCFNI